jgi:hypothetical protein
MIKFTHGSLYAAILILIVFMGCKKEPAAKTTSGHYLSASSGTIGSFSATGTNVIAAGATGAKIEIVADATSGQSITLFLNPYGGATGVYPIVSGSLAAGGTYNPSSGTGFSSSTSGNITLTAVMPDLIGTFNYTASDGSTFTGSFNVAAP